MKSVAQTEYAAHPELYSDYVDPSTGITDDNYFYVASKYRLGTAQSAQFQSGNQYGGNWHWGSKCNPTPSDATKISDVTSISCNSNATAANNVLAEMPREYYRSINPYGSLYNWYGATAESGHRGMNNGQRTADSICPSGWKLSGSYYSLFNSGYGTGSVFNATDANNLRSIPLSFPLSGYYNQNGSMLHEMVTSRNATRMAHNSTDLSYMYFTALEGGTSYNMPMNQGTSVRCVKE